jgi:hypothetical protein
MPCEPCLRRAPSHDTCDEELNRRLDAIESKVSRIVAKLDALQQLVADLASGATGDGPGVPSSRPLIQGREGLILDGWDGR